MNMNNGKNIIWFSKLLPGIGEIKLEAVKYGNRGKRKILLLGLHGDELTPYYIVSQLLEKIIIKGFTLEIIPVINLGGLITGKRMDLIYGYNYNRYFNNQKDENIISEITSALYNYIKDADFILDMHNWDSPTSIFGICFNSKGIKDADYLNTYATLGVDFILDSGNSSDFNNSLGNKLNSVNYFPIEFPSQNLISESTIIKCRDNLIQVLYEKLVDKSPIIIKERKYLNTFHSGIFQSLVMPGDFIDKGMILGKIINPLEKFKQYDIISSESGYVLYFENRKFVLKGDVLYSIGQPY